MQNLRSEYKPFLAISFIALQIMDFTTSSILLNTYGFEHELNPLIWNNETLFISLLVGVIIVPLFYKFCFDYMKTKKQAKILNTIFSFLVFMKIFIVLSNIYLL